MTKITRAIFTMALSVFISACAGLDVDPTADWTAQDFYEEARSALDAAEFKTAIDNLETLEARFPFDPYAKQAQLDIAYSYYKFDEPDSAVSAVDRFLRLHPRDANIDYAYYLKGLVNFNRGKGLLDGWFPRDMSRHEPSTLQKSFQAFSTLVKRFPDSRYAGDAYQRMIYLRNMLAKHEINNAKFYIERGAWIAAANRAHRVLERYQESPWSIEALEVMIESYRNLGLEDLVTDTQKILDLNKDKAGKKTLSLDNDEKFQSPPRIGS